MVPPRSTRLSAVSLVALLLASCATQAPLSSVDRTKFKTIAINPDIKAPDRYVYRDTTGKRARGIGAHAGVIGLLVGGMIGAGSEGPGFRRFDSAASKHPVDIRELVRSRMTATFRSSQMFQVVAAPNADAAFNLEILAYGVAPLNDRNLGAVINARATLVDRDGKTRWSKVEWGGSSTTGPLEAYESDPRLWSRTAAEAADDLARKMVLVLSPTQRAAAPTSL